MWYEAIPSALIVVACMYTIPVHGLKWLVWLDTNGRFERRNHHPKRDRSLTRRDEFLTGNYFAINGLEVIPDLPETEQKKD